VFTRTHASAAALQITAPEANAAWDLSGSNVVTWSSVSTDPTTFNINLVNNGGSSGAQAYSVATGVSTSDGKYTITNFVAPIGSTYVIQLMANSTLNSGILAASQTFNVTKSGGKCISHSSAVLSREWLEILLSVPLYIPSAPAPL
jgi:hypothetical protein